MNWYAVCADIYYKDKQKELERIKEESGLSWRKFAESFGIPYRTVQDWHLGNRPIQEYILRLMLYCAIGMVVSLLCCLQGIRIYKAVLLIFGFVQGFDLATNFMDLVPQDMIPEFFSQDWQLMFRVMCGLLLAVFAYRTSGSRGKLF